MGMTMVVTGATDGIGRAAALALARRGARVILLGRSQEKGEAVLGACEAACPGGGHRFVAADLSRMADVARAAGEVRALAPQVDGLVHSAGLISGRPVWTEDGFELNFATNYLGRFLLTRLLEPQLLAAPEPRVVIIASPGSHPDELDLEDLQLRRRFSGQRAFRQGQFANDLWAQALQRKVPRLTVSEVFPGLVKSNIFRAATDMPLPLRMAGLVASVVGLTPEAAAEVPVRCATDPDTASLRGAAFGPGMKRRTLGASVLRAERQDQLWDASVKLLGSWLGA